MTGVFSIIGRSGSGKTTLIENLVRHYRARGLAVAVLKHTLHEIDQENPRKDTGRYLEAGAGGIMLSNGQSASIRLERCTDPVDAALHLFRDYDILIVEGMKGSELPKIEVVGGSAEAPLHSQGVSGIRIVVSDLEQDTTLPLFRTDDIAGIVSAIDSIIFRKGQ